MEPISITDLEHVTGGAGEGPFLTEVLRQGMNPPRTSSAPVRRHLQRSKDAPGWCDDGMGIVPCR